MRIQFFQDDNGWLKQLCLSRPFGPDFIAALAPTALGPAEEPLDRVLPAAWLAANPRLKVLEPLTYESIAESVGAADEWVYWLNGAVRGQLDNDRLRASLEVLAWDAVSVQISPHLQGSSEQLKLTPADDVVGVRRCYKPSMEPAAEPSQWPDIMIFKPAVWQRLCADGAFPPDFQAVRAQLDAAGAAQRHLQVGGRVRRYTTAAALLAAMEDFQPVRNGHPVPAAARIVGRVFCGADVTVEPGVTLVGPTVLSDGVQVKAGAVVRRSILTEGAVVEAAQTVNNRILDPAGGGEQACCAPSQAVQFESRIFDDTEYKNWPRLSYARFGKRIFDIVASLAVLMLLAPVLAVVAAVLKITSPGPIFYRARRQGRHGEEFDCLKFRSMMIAADAMQERLRSVNQVDGPQFKMDNDPRITGVGRFLRDTYIDELPQFLNVLAGQMSIVGPRPSPESENAASPAWRDARLSVRPGITGLWQVMRTRQEGVDFQEWVYYDTRYVRNLSFRSDLWLCWKTAEKLIHSFLGQFG